MKETKRLSALTLHKLGCCAKALSPWLTGATRAPMNSLTEHRMRAKGGGANTPVNRFRQASGLASHTGEAPKVHREGFDV